MAINNILGSAGFVDQGDYSTTTTYKYLNIVRQDNHWYLCRLRTGVLNVAPPATFTDSTEWRALLESGDNNLSTISKDPDTGVVTIVRKGLADFTIDEGHVISKNSDSALGQRKNLKITASADIVVDNPDASTTEIDFTDLETALGLNTLKRTYPQTEEDKVTANSLKRSFTQAYEDEVDVNTAKTGLSDQQVLDIAASELVTKYIDVSQDVDLDTLEAELKAILDALGHSDIGVITQTLNIPVSTGNVATSNFTRNNVVVNDTTGVITAGTGWTYAGGGELYQLPQLAYHSQIASVNSDDDILVVTIGVVASIKYHASLIKVLEDYIAHEANPGQANTPDPKATYLENYQGQQFSPATNHLDGSTEGIEVIAQTSPGSYTKLFTISFGIISAIKDHYDSESRFFIQNDRGIRGYVQHTGTDTVITAALKAAIEANRAAIDINKDKLNKYPGLAAIQNASDGQIISISETNVAGTKASMTFNVSSVNTFSMTDTLLMTVSYPDGSPLTDFFDVEVTVPIGAADTTTTVAETIVTNFNAKTGNANLATFVDGYTGTDGFAYGGYVASSVGNTVTFASINDGEVYNAAIGLYEAQEYYDVGNVTQLAHGTGGPKKEFTVIDAPSGGATAYQTTGTGAEGFGIEVTTLGTGFDNITVVWDAADNMFQATSSGEGLTWVWVHQIAGGTRLGFQDDTTDARRYRNWNVNTPATAAALNSSIAANVVGGEDVTYDTVAEGTNGETWAFDATVNGDVLEFYKTDNTSLTAQPAVTFNGAWAGNTTTVVDLQIVAGQVFTIGQFMFYLSKVYMCVLGYTSTAIDDFPVVDTTHWLPIN